MDTFDRDVTIPRCVIFRDAIMDLFIVELGDRMTTLARETWRAMLTYVGGALMYVKVNYRKIIDFWLDG